MKPTETKTNLIEARIKRGLWNPGEQTLAQKRDMPRSAWSGAFQSARQALINDRQSQGLDGQLTGDDLTNVGLAANTLVQDKRAKAMVREMYHSRASWDPHKKTPRSKEGRDLIRAQMMQQVDEQWSAMKGMSVDNDLDLLNKGRFETRLVELHNAGELGYVRDENGRVIAEPIWGNVYRRQK